MGQPIDGKSIAAGIRTRLREDVAALGRTPGLAAVLVGDDPASALYVDLKSKACTEVGIHFELHRFAAATDTAMLRERIRALGKRDDVDGILVQLPLPPGVDTDAVIAVVPPTKDADGFHPVNLTRLQKGDPLVTSSLAKAVLACIDATGESLHGKRAVLVANSELVCRPIEWLLRNRGVDCLRCAPFQPAVHRPEHTSRADMLVSALGCGGCLGPEYVKDGAILIDIGIARGASGAVLGDFSPAARERSGWYTPVPGGVGPVTVAMLLENVVEAARRIRA